MADGDRPDPFAPSREGSLRSHRLSVSDPKNIGLPRTGRNYVLPITIALVVFAVIMLVRLTWD